jgi:hypothetical protein
MWDSLTNQAKQTQVLEKQASSTFPKKQMVHWQAQNQLGLQGTNQIN